MNPRLLLVALALTLPQAVQGQASDRVERLRTAFPEIDRRMRSFAQEQHIPGIAYGIVADGRVVHVGTFGMRDVASGAPVDERTVFRIASMSKSFVAAAVLQLRDRGLLSLEDPAERYVPELAGLRLPSTDAPKLTIRHLLSHSAGFPEDNPWGDQQLAVTDDEMSEMMRAGIPFSTAPGTAYEYSNFGFAILGRIVANVAGEPYSRYVERELFRPLGMSATTLEAGEVPADRLAHGYRWQDESWLEEPALPDGAFGPMGGILASSEDLARWVVYMLDAWPARDGGNEGPLRRSSRREMQQVARIAPATVLVGPEGEVDLSAGGYGYGLGVRQTCELNHLVQHSGGLPGYGSVMRWLPEQGVGIFAMGNRTYTGWTGVTSEAFDLLAATGGLEPELPEPAPVLLQRRAEVSRLVASWEDALADSLAAVNLFLDLDRDRRRAEIERLRAEAGGECRQEGPLVTENALRGAWRMRCARGDLLVSITLSPQVPARVQYLRVATIGREEPIRPLPACRVRRP